MAELIKQRVYSEVEEYLNSATKRTGRLVEPTIVESALNRGNSKSLDFKTKSVDAEKQYYLALEAFQKNGFFIIVDDKQVNDLNEKISITSRTSATFVKLTPLVGG